MINNKEILQKLKWELDYALYCWDRSAGFGHTPYQQELADMQEITLPKRQKPLYDCEEAGSLLRHLNRMIIIYENKEKDTKEKK